MSPLAQQREQTKGVGSSGREARRSAAGEKREPEQCLAVSQSKALRALARKLIQSAPKRVARPPFFDTALLRDL